MKEILNSFEYLPRLSEYLPKVKEYWINHDLFKMGENYGQRNAEIIGSIYKYTDFITQPLSSSVLTIILTGEIVSFCRANKDCTIEDAINAGVKLKLKR
jgi:hypothetical protein